MTQKGPIETLFHALNYFQSFPMTTEEWNGGLAIFGGAVWGLAAEVRKSEAIRLRSVPYCVYGQMAPKNR